MRFYPPVMFFLFIFAIVALVFFFILLQLHIITFAFEKLGFSTFTVFVILMGSLIGSMINIPVKELECDDVVQEPVRFWGMRYKIPQAKPSCTVVAVNVGGAIVPAVVSVYLWLRGGMIIPVIATAIVALIVNRISRPVRGLGIATPILIPPLVTLVVAFILASGDAARVAYISGTMGTIIGADLMNLRKISGLGAPIASIGGAGTFDGIFITGILAVLLA